MYFLTEATGTSVFDFSTIDLSAIVPTFMSAVGIGIAVAITIVATKKGISWLMGMVKRA